MRPNQSRQRRGICPWTSVACARLVVVAPSWAVATREHVQAANVSAAGWHNSTTKPLVITLFRAPAFCLPPIGSLLLGALCMLSIGCADDGMVDIAGNVSFDGQLVVQGTISFFPADGQGATAEAVIAAGSYSLSLPRGKKHVVVHGYKKVGERFPWGKDNPPAPILNEIIPAKFNDDSILTIEVDNDRGDVNFFLAASEGADKPG